MTAQEKVEQCKRRLTSAGIEFEHLSQWHFRIKYGSSHFDYWPSTGKWWRPGLKSGARYITIDGVINMARIKFGCVETRNEQN